MEDTTTNTRQLQNYFSREITMLRICGISLNRKNDSIAYKIYSVSYLCLYFAYPVVAFGDLLKHDFEVVSDLLIYEIAAIMASIEAIVIILNSSRVKELLEKLEREPFIPNYERGGDVEGKLIRGCVSFTSMQATTCWLCLLVTVGMATMFTFVKRLLSSDPNDWEFAYGPLTVVNVTYSPNFEISWLYQVVCATAVGLNHCTVNITMAGILAHASVQFKVLQNNLRRLVENARRMTLKGKDWETTFDNNDLSKISYKYLKKSLGDAVQYHLEILEITAEMDNIFSILTLSIFLLSLGILCFIVYHASVLSMSDMRFLKSFTDAITILFPILLLCYWGQEVIFESQEVGKAVFQINFEGTDLNFQRGLIMIIRRSQKPMLLKAGKLIEISLDTFVWILRTSYSAFMVLHKVNTEEP